MEKIPLIAIVGPTAVGKTALSIELAKKFNCEIISIDSVQIYKRFDIGSAKVTPEEMNGVVHHLIDELEPNATCSVYDFQKLARDKIDDIHSRGKMPLLIGGTGFYMNAVLNNYEFTNLEEKTYDIDVEKAKQYLKENYIDTYNNIDLDNHRRVINAYNYVMNEQKSVTTNNNGDTILEKYNPYLIVLNTEREVLYNRINKRVELMFEQGLEDEVKGIINDYGTELQALGAIGYKEMLPYLKGDVSKEETISAISQNSRRYAKRQLTWFRNKMNGVWYDTRSESLLDDVIEDIKNNPDGRRHIMSLWQEDVFKEKHALKPCAFMTIWNVRHGRDGASYLDMELIQRSSDFMAAGCINQMQYLALLYYVAKSCGYEVGRFSWNVLNVQIYSRHIRSAIKLLKREPVNCNPKYILETNTDDFFDMKLDDIKLDGYEKEKVKEKNPQIKLDLGI